MKNAYSHDNSAESPILQPNQRYTGKVTLPWTKVAVDIPQTARLNEVPHERPGFLRRVLTRYDESKVPVSVNFESKYNKETGTRDFSIKQSGKMSPLDLTYTMGQAEGRATLEMGQLRALYQALAQNDISFDFFNEEYVKNIDSEFTGWLLKEPQVTHVFTDYYAPMRAGEKQGISYIGGLVALINNGFDRKFIDLAREDVEGTRQAFDKSEAWIEKVQSVQRNGITDEELRAILQ